jgi:diaminopimelate epimerase
MVRQLAFAKYQGLGNDFIIVDGRSSGAPTAALARRLCDRRRGIGADGVLTLLPSRTKDAEVRMHIYNADGSVAEMCGNGLRCVVRHLGKNGAIETGAGVLRGTIEGEAVRVELGEARIIDDAIDVELEGRTLTAIGVSMGNPHLVLPPFPASTDLMALAREHGPRLERHPRFPQRVNVELVKPLADGSLELVVFERGAGITEACGTGAGATAFASLLRKTIAAPPVTVRLPGGALDVFVRDRRIEIRGPAEHSFDGTVAVGEGDLTREAPP